MQSGFEFKNMPVGARTVRCVPPPIYDLRDWRHDVGKNGSLICVPSGRTLFRRLGWTFLAALFLGLLTWTYGLPGTRAAKEAQAEASTARAAKELTEKARQLEQTFQEGMDEDQRRDFQQKLAEKRRKSAAKLQTAGARLDVMRTIGGIVHWCTTLALLALGILPPLSCTWQRLAIEPIVDAEFVVRWRGLWSHVRGWPVSSLTGIEVAAEEHIVRTRRPTYTRIHEGWRWLVRLCETRATLPGVPEPGTPAVEFYVDHDKDQPLDVTQPPRRVLRFVKHLRKLTGLSKVQFSLIKESSYERGLFRSTRRLRTTTVTEPEVNRREFHSLDEMPPELRQKFERMMAEGVGADKPVTKEFIKFRIRDSDGNDRTYTSLDEMPPDVREAFERGRRMARRKQAD